MKHGSQFVISRPRPEATSRLFCFPHAGGSPVAFFDWAERLGREIECVCVLYAGRGQRLREEPRTSVEELVDEIDLGFDEWMDKPFAFYGHSFGGIVAFELSRRMRGGGRNGMAASGFDSGPHHLFVGATRPPHLELPHPMIHHLPDREFAAKVQTRYGGIPEAIYGDSEALGVFLPAMRADFTGYETYRFQPGAPLDISITAFGGEGDMIVPPASLQEWALHTAADFDVNVLPGGHFFPTTSGTELIQTMRVCIETHLRTHDLHDQDLKAVR